MRMKVGTRKRMTKRLAKARRVLNKPVSGTDEWAKHRENLQSGCENDCIYCYAKANACQFKRKTPDNWCYITTNEKQVTKGYRKRKGTIMFPTSHDITESNVDNCIAVLKKMLKAGNRVLIVSKPSLKVIKRLCRELADYRHLILFRFTIGSADNRVLRYWEPNAPRFAERIKSCGCARANGFDISISCEPMLDTRIDRVINAVRPFEPRSVWLGMPNKLVQRASMCSGKDEAVKAKARSLAALFTDEFILALYERYKDDPMIKWKDSIKKIVGLERPTEKGLDI